MDPFTHAILGATAATAAARKPEERRMAAFAGAVAGEAPDLDIVIRSAIDPFTMIEYHRHFTHALAFVPLGALIMAVLCKLVLRKRISFWKLLLFCFIGFALHGFLDSCTNYGTHWLWPFLERRESWNIISIVDPLFTLPLFACLMTAVWLRKRKPVLIGLLYAVCYLSFGYLQKERAESALSHVAMERGDVVERMIVSPSLGNLILWNGTYQTHDTYYIEALRITSSGKVTHMASDTAPALTDAARGNLVQPDSVQAKDLDRFRFFADGWLSPQPGTPKVLADMRFSRMPGKASPIWGIAVDYHTPNDHARFVNLPGGGRNLGAVWQMILGNAPAKP